MKILFIARDFKSYTTRRIIESARVQGFDVVTAETGRVIIVGTSLYLGECLLPAPDVALVKTTIDAAGRDYALSVIRCLELQGVKVVNSALSVERACNKFYTYQVLTGAGIPAVPTVLIADPGCTDKALELLGGCPAVVKFLYGTHGTGVVQASSPSMAESLIASYRALGINVCLQPYIAESRGETVRILMAGGRALTSLRMIPGEGGWCSNYHRGGTLSLMERDEAFVDLAGRAMNALGLHYGGVDIIESSSGPLILEVNSSPGLEGAEKVSGSDMATGIVESLVELCSRA